MSFVGLSRLALFRSFLALLALACAFALNPSRAGAKDKLDLNDISILFPPPDSEAAMNLLIAADELKGNDGKPLLPPAFEAIKAIATSKFGVVLANDFSGQRVPFQIKFSAGRTDISELRHWRVAALRIDPGAPGLSPAIARAFGRSTQIRLTLQPVTKSGAKVTDHDFAIHLVFSLSDRFLPINERGCVLLRVVPNDLKFAQIVGEIRALKAAMAAGQIGNGGTIDERMVDTSGPLGVHPGLKNENVRNQLRNWIKDFIERHLNATKLQATAIMGLPRGFPEPWIFMAMQRTDPRVRENSQLDEALQKSGEQPLDFIQLGFVPAPAIAIEQGESLAQLLSFMSNPPEISPQPATNNSADRITCRFGNAVGDPKGLDTGPMFKGDTSTNAMDIVRRIADPEKSHFFNTDCVSCHTETQRSFNVDLSAEERKARDELLQDIDENARQKESWNVRNFGWFDGNPSITLRTLNETKEVLHYINQNFRPLGADDRPENVVKPKNVKWLRQGWTNAERHWFHHISQQTSTLPLPYDWFLALAQPGADPSKSEPLLRDPNYLARFGFIPSTRSIISTPREITEFAERVLDDQKAIDKDDVERLVKLLKRRWDNDDNLPIGFARSPGLNDPQTGQRLPDQIGLTCAACHTGELRHKGTALRIDGGAAMISVEKFQTALGVAIVQTAASAEATSDADRKRFDNFANRLMLISREKRRPMILTREEIEGATNDEIQQRIKAKIGEGIRTIARRLMGAVALETQEFFKRQIARHARGDFSETWKHEHIPEGFGRLDALNRIGNEVFHTNLIPVIVQRAAKIVEQKAAAEGAAGRSLSRQELARLLFVALQQESQTEFGFDINMNYASRNAPVSFPPIWTVPWHTWAQYDSSILQPLVRNAGEALGVRAKVNLIDKKGGEALYRSVVDMEQMFSIERLLRGQDPRKGAIPLLKFTGLTAPRWPGFLPGEVATALGDPDSNVKHMIFEPGTRDGAWDIDAEMWRKGRVLYEENCSGCHLAPVRDPSNGEVSLWDQRNWGRFGQAKHETLLLRQLKVEDIGTDPALANILPGRDVHLPDNIAINPWQDLGKPGNVPGAWGCDPQSTPDETFVSNKDGLKPAKFGIALMVLVEKVVGKYFADKNITDPAEQRAIVGELANCPNAQFSNGYRARPLNGVWATAPYLHNGSVPSLWDMISPPSERPKQFCVGSREFDPKKVGLTTDCVAGTTVLDTTITGNLNNGHEFRGANKPDKPTDGHIGRGFSEEERWQLIEYLKTL